MKTSSREFRQMQRERIMKTKPWLKTKGPITPEGKERSKMNALKVSPELYTLMKEYKQLIAQQKEICKTIKHFE
ncbi:hypothetical protein TSL6_10490 [Sulfurovum sp. TSL6]|uniref:hypothetical protein n=1 Tax=Sulfurovum sp. TSL6 TaxID=2826995 RepID=UPI001CC76E5A|nr:hypothetical protein [Sulfurovum sp. TSL6]GIU00543.1 hypothetical protein TSL6_10490 [Sulfurovum sp. TSL6]